MTSQTCNGHAALIKLILANGQTQRATEMSSARTRIAGV